MSFHSSKDFRLAVFAIWRRYPRWRGPPRTSANDSTICSDALSISKRRDITCYISYTISCYVILSVKSLGCQTSQAMSNTSRRCCRFRPTTSTGRSSSNARPCGFPPSRGSLSSVRPASPCQAITLQCAIRLGPWTPRPDGRPDIEHMPRTSRANATCMCRCLHKDKRNTVSRISQMLARYGQVRFSL